MSTELDPYPGNLRKHEVDGTMDDKVQKYFDQQRKDEELGRIHNKVRAEAVAIYGKTGLTPSELAEQLEEARRLLVRARPHVESDRAEAIMAERHAWEANAESCVDDIDAFLSRTSPTDPTPPEK